MRGPRRSVSASIVLVWLPFIPAGGPANYLRNLGEYQNDIFSVLSLRAWNVWWILQVVAAGGDFAKDTTAVLGPVTFRHIGYLVTGLLEAVVFLAVLRDPRPRTLILGLAASTLIAFCFLTTMHERYAYGALVFLMLLLVERPRPGVGDRLRDRVHPEPARGRATDPGHRRIAARRRCPWRGRIAGDACVHAISCLWLLFVARSRRTAPAVERLDPVHSDPGSA